MAKNILQALIAEEGMFLISDIGTEDIDKMKIIIEIRYLYISIEIFNKLS